MNTPKTDSAPDVKDLETELRIALSWMEAYYRYARANNNGPLAQDIARIKELLKP